MDMYREFILDLYRNPLNKGELLGHTHRAREFNPTCGDDLTLELHIENNIVIDAKFTGSGCAISTVGASLITDRIKGKKISEITQYTKQTIDECFGFPVVYTRESCAMLALRAAISALQSPVSP